MLAAAATCVPWPLLLLLQGGGVFCNPKSPSAPAKLRLLYECAPLALIVEVRQQQDRPHAGWGAVSTLLCHEVGESSAGAAV